MKNNRPTNLRCPICGGTISSNRKFFGCDNYKMGCNYKIWRDFMGVELSDADIKDLIQTGKTSRKIGGFYSKKMERTFACHLVYSKTNNRVEFEKLRTV